MRFARMPTKPAPERTGCSLSCNSDENQSNQLEMNICKWSMAKAIPSHKAKLISYGEKVKDGVPRTILDVTEQAKKGT